MSAQIEPTDGRLSASTLQALDRRPGRGTVSEHMSGVEGRSASTRRSTPLASMTIAVLVAACTGSGGPGAPASDAAASTQPPATTAPTTAPSAAPSEEAFVRPEPSPLESAEPEAALEKLWSATGPTKAQPWVWSPTVDPSGRIWAASSFDDAFWIIDPEGSYLETWAGAGAGKGEGEFNFDAEGNGYGDVTFRPDGGFYVADSGNARVQQFDAKRQFVDSFGKFGTDQGEFVLPLDIDIDGEGNVYVLDGSRQDIQVFDPDGEFFRIAATSVGPYVAVDLAGNVYGVDNQHVVLYRFTPQGKVDLAIDLKAVVPFATGIDLTPAGDIIIGVSDTGGAVPTYLSLIQLGPDGALEHVWPNGAEAVAVDPSGDQVYLTYSDRAADVTAYALPAD
jgi:NHL repeat